MTGKLGLVLRLQQAEEYTKKLEERNRVLEETLRAAYIALKKHELYDIDIVGEAMGILEEKAWG
jgi:hypothetical protein